MKKVDVLEAAKTLAAKIQSLSDDLDYLYLTQTFASGAGFRTKRAENKASVIERKIERLDTKYNALLDSIGY